VQLVRSRGAGLHRAGPGETHLAECFDRTITRFRQCGGVTRTYGPGRHLGIDPIGLPAPTTPMTIRLVHLDDVQSAYAQMPGQTRAPRSGAFDTEREDFTQAGHPARQVAIAATGGRERCRVERAAEFVEDDYDMEILVGVDSGDDALCRRLRSLTLLPCLLAGEGGTHGREGGQDREQAWSLRRLFGHDPPGRLCLTTELASAGRQVSSRTQRSSRTRSHTDQDEPRRMLAAAQHDRTKIIPAALWPSD
jgi:hypothetical protein